MNNTLDKCIKERDNPKLLISNQRSSYSKVDIGYETKNNLKSFSNICYLNMTLKYNILKYNDCNKNSHVALFFYIKKSYESKNSYPPSNFYTIIMKKNEKHIYFILFQCSKF